MPNELLESMLSDFLDESEELLTNLNDNLLKVDEWVNALGDDDAANRACRAVSPSTVNHPSRP